MAFSTPIEEEGYKTLRGYMESNWTTHKLYETEGSTNPQFESDITQVNTEWVHTSDNPMILQTEITGEELANNLGVSIDGDGFLATGITIGHSQVYHDNEETFENPLAKQDVTNFTFEHETDKMTVQHYILAPKSSE